jgi:hypothetical protein
MAFETFKRQRAPITTEPAVTIQKRGTISFNAPAYEALGAPDQVELLYDRDARLIGFRKADQNVEHAYIVRPLGKGSTHMVSGTAFLAYYGIEFEVARRWIARQQDDLLVVDLKEPGIEVTGNRARLMPGSD